jgi:hypothetical protein
MTTRGTAIAAILIGLLSFYLITMQSGQATTSSEEEMEEQEKTELQTYTNEDFKFTINYPSDWEPSELDLIKYEIARFTPTEEPRAVVGVYIYDAGETNKTLTELINEGIEYSNNPQISKINTTLAGLPAVQQVYYQYDFGTVKSMETTALTSSGDLITLHYVTDPGTFDEYFPIVNQMIESFKLIP